MTLKPNSIVSSDELAAETNQSSKSLLATTTKNQKGKTHPINSDFSFRFKLLLIHFVIVTGVFYFQKMSLLMSIWSKALFVF